MRTKLSHKTIILLSFILFSTMIASAQVRLGARGGFDVANNSINKDILKTENRLGFQAGLTLEVMAPVVGWGGEVSVLYGHQEYDLKTKTEFANKEYNFTDYNYIRIPLNLKKKFKVIDIIGIFGTAGPYAEIKLSGGDFEEKGGLEQFKSKSFGMGINAGFGVEILNRIEVGMYYRKHLTDDFSADKASIGDYLWKKKPDNWSVDLTYYF